ncbi:MAG: O-antigen ligase family protein [Myxococcota bacterium]|nr:O-antigen ligase family protein [Myxococcota bacterium]
MPTPTGAEQATLNEQARSLLSIRAISAFVVLVILFWDHRVLDVLLAKRLVVELGLLLWAALELAFSWRSTPQAPSQQATNHGESSPNWGLPLIIAAWAFIPSAARGVHWIPLSEGSASLAFFALAVVLFRHHGQRAALHEQLERWLSLLALAVAAGAWLEVLLLGGEPLFSGAPIGAQGNPNHLGALLVLLCPLPLSRALRQPKPLLPIFALVFSALSIALTRSNLALLAFAVVLLWLASRTLPSSFWSWARRLLRLEHGQETSPSQSLAKCPHEVGAQAKLHPVLQGQQLRVRAILLVVLLSAGLTAGLVARSWLDQRRAPSNEHLGTTGQAPNRQEIQPDIDSLSHAWQGRAYLWSIDFAAIAANPWLGAGTGEYPWAFAMAQGAHLQQNPQDLPLHTHAKHGYNLLLELLVEHGIIGLAALVLAWLLLKDRRQRQARGRPTLERAMLARAALFLLLCMASAALFVPPLALLGAYYLGSALALRSPPLDASVDVQSSPLPESARRWMGLCALSTASTRQRILGVITVLVFLGAAVRMLLAYHAEHRLVDALEASELGHSDEARSTLEDARLSYPNAELLFALGVQRLQQVSDTKALQRGGTGQVPNRQELGGTGQVPNRQELGGTGQVPNQQELGGTGQVPNQQELGGTGQVPNQQEALEGAASAFGSAASLAPSAEIHYNYGVTLCKLGQVEAAQERFTFALYLDPSLELARDALQQCSTNVD